MALKPGVLCQVQLSSLAQLYTSSQYYDSCEQPYFIALYPNITLYIIRNSNLSLSLSKLGKHIGYLLTTIGTPLLGSKSMNHCSHGDGVL